MYFRECPYCGCHLDPGEKCDCREESERYVRRMQEQMDVEKKSKQYRFKMEPQSKVAV